MYSSPLNSCAASRHSISQYQATALGPYCVICMCASGDERLCLCFPSVLRPVSKAGMSLVLLPCFCLMDQKGKNKCHMLASGCRFKCTLHTLPRLSHDASQLIEFHTPLLLDRPPLGDARSHCTLPRRAVPDTLYRNGCSRTACRGNSSTPAAHILHLQIPEQSWTIL
jgi:hypothetical protein